MRKNNLILLVLALLAVQNVFGAAIDFGNANLLKRIKTSFDSPVDLYQSTLGGAAHQNKIFTARTLLRLGPTVGEYEYKAIRNEICASHFIYLTANNNALDISQMPGSMGVYLLNDRVVSVADTGMIGEPLDSVLRKLSNEPAETKVFAARYYAVAMTAALEAIHEADVLWNNVSLRNFIVRPDGTLYAKDFSEATKAVGAPPAIATAKQADWKELVVNTINQMYHLLFPTDAVRARAEYLALVNAAGAVGAANIRTHAWDQAAFVAELNAALPNAANAGFAAGVNTGGLGGAFAPHFAGNTAAFLTQPENIPYRANALQLENIAKGDHAAAVGSIDNGQNFVLSDDVRNLLIDPATGVAYANNLAAVCGTWTGR